MGLTQSGATVPTTTKGDLSGFSTVAARVPVGADATVLTADSTQPLGVKWGAGATDLSLLPKAVLVAHGELASGVGVGNMVFAPGNNGLLAVGSGAACGALFGFDPADYAIAGKTLQVSVAGAIWNAAGSEPADLSIALLPITSIAGAGNITGLGAATCSALLHAAGANSAIRPGRSAWVTAPAVGGFVLALVVATATTTGIVAAEARLEIRHF